MRELGAGEQPLLRARPRLGRPHAAHVPALVRQPALRQERVRALARRDRRLGRTHARGRGRRDRHRHRRPRRESLPRAARAALAGARAPDHAAAAHSEVVSAHARTRRPQQVEAPAPARAALLLEPQPDAPRVARPRAARVRGAGCRDRRPPRAPSATSTSRPRCSSSRACLAAGARRGRASPGASQTGTEPPAHPVAMEVGVTPRRPDRAAARDPRRQLEADHVTRGRTGRGRALRPRSGSARAPNRRGERTRRRRRGSGRCCEELATESVEAAPMDEEDEAILAARLEELGYL